MSFRVVSADCHLDLRFLPEDTFVSRVPAKDRERVPHVKETPEGKCWFAEGDQNLERFGWYGPGLNGGKKAEQLVAEGFTRGEPRTSNIPQRLADQERDGVDAEVIYGLLGLSRRIQNKDTLMLIYNTYNEWVAEWQKGAPGHLYPLGQVTNHDAEIAAEQVRRSARLGLCGVEFSPATAVKPMWDPYWAPLWDALVETDIPVALHAFNIAPSGPGGQRDVVTAGAGLVTDPEKADMCMASLIYGGLFERHPKLVVGLGESGIGWLPYILERLDYCWEDRLQDLKLPNRPTGYFKSNMFATYIKDQVGTRVMWELGYLDNIMWSTDYPHRDGTWPDSKKAIEWTFQGLPEEVKRACMHDNVCRVYRIAE